MEAEFFIWNPEVYHGRTGALLYSVDGQQADKKKAAEAALAMIRKLKLRPAGRSASS
jgi:hypothetical protein